MQAQLMDSESSSTMSFCRLKMASGERVLISIARHPEPSVEVTRLGFFGLIPLDTLWEYNPLMSGGPLEFLDLVCGCLVACDSIDDARLALAELEVWSDPSPKGS